MMSYLARIHLVLTPLAVVAGLWACADPPAVGALTDSQATVVGADAPAAPAGAGLAPCSGALSVAEPRSSVASSLDAERGLQMWRYCVAGGSGMRHVCLHELVLACG